MRIDHLQEPELEFGLGQHVDIRFGIMDYGPLDVASWRAFASGWRSAATKFRQSKADSLTYFRAFQGFGPISLSMRRSCSNLALNERFLIARLKSCPNLAMQTDSWWRRLVCVSKSSAIW